jgi:hypothetical protein
MKKDCSHFNEELFAEKVKQECLAILILIYISSLFVFMKFFLNDLTGVCRQTNTHWIVMGITGGGKLKERLVEVIR